MPTSATGISSIPERSRGFTLLELLLAVALIGLALSLVALSIGGFSGPRPLDEAHALADRLALIHEEAGFTGRIIGMRLRDDPTRDDDETLEFLELTLVEGDKLPTWQPADGHDPLLASAPLGARMRVTLEVDAAQDHGAGAMPQVLLMPDGELTPFVLSFRSHDDDAAVARLTALEDGTLSVAAHE